MSIQVLNRLTDDSFENYSTRFGAEFMEAWSLLFHYDANISHAIAWSHLPFGMKVWEE